MKPEQQRITIALATGIVDINSKCWRGHRDGYEVSIPDYLNDLNAMHEAEKVLTEDQLRDYWSNLWLVVKPKTAIHLLCHATAAQRAEAFLRTIGKMP